MIVHVVFGGICRSDCESGTRCKARATQLADLLMEGIAIICIRRSKHQS